MSSVVSDLRANVGRTYRHIHLGRLYHLFDICTIKTRDGDWVDGVIYASKTFLEGKIVCEANDFVDNFELMGRGTEQ